MLATDSKAEQMMVVIIGEKEKEVESLDQMVGLFHPVLDRRIEC